MVSIPIPEWLNVVPGAARVFRVSSVSGLMGWRFAEMNFSRSPRERGD